MRRRIWLEDPPLKHPDERSILIGRSAISPANNRRSCIYGIENIEKKRDSYQSGREAPPWGVGSDGPQHGKAVAVAVQASFLRSFTTNVMD